MASIFLTRATTRTAVRASLSLSSSVLHNFSCSAIAGSPAWSRSFQSMQCQNQMSMSMSNEMCLSASSNAINSQSAGGAVSTTLPVAIVAKSAPFFLDYTRMFCIDDDGV